MAWLDDEAEDDATTMQPKVIQIPAEELAKAEAAAKEQVVEEVSTTRR